MRLPEPVRELLVTAVSSRPKLIPLPVGGLLLDTIESGQGEIFASITEHEDQPAFIGAVRTAGKNLSGFELAPLLKNALANETHIGVRSGSQRIKIGMADRILRVVAGGPSTSFPDLSDKIEAVRSEKKPPLFWIKGDLEKWAGRPDDSGSSHLIRAAEATYDRWFHSRVQARFHRAGGFTWKESDFLSLSKHMTDGDWKFNASIQAGSHGVEGDFRVGKDLSDFCVARYQQAWDRVLGARQNP